ncbi:hypothetical protein DFH29DRAFT_1072425, partial [Suillus ampliporus]
MALRHAQALLGVCASSYLAWSSIHAPVSLSYLMQVDEKVLQLEGHTGGLQYLDSVRLASISGQYLKITPFLNFEPIPSACSQSITFCVKQPQTSSHSPALRVAVSVANVFTNLEKKYEDTSDSGIAAFVALCIDEVSKLVGYLTQLPLTPPGSAATLPPDDDGRTIYLGTFNRLLAGDCLQAHPNRESRMIVMPHCL